jgi:RNA polymerase nonessential primary-like sigma factor
MVQTTLSTELYAPLWPQLLRSKRTIRRRTTFRNSTTNLTLVSFLFVLPLVVLSFSLSIRRQSPSKRMLQNFPSTTKPDKLDFFRPSNLQLDIRQQKLVSLARLSNVEEKYGIVPNRILRNEETASTYSLIDRDRRKPIIITEETVPLVDDESNSNIVRKRTRMAINASPKSIRRETAATSKTTTKPRKSRSSTMPGFSSINTEKQRAFRDSVRLVEERSGRKFIDTTEKKQQRRKINGETMYKNSPSVPDSLVQFATEIHQEERITRKEEIELGEKTQEAIRIQHLFDSLEDRLGREPTDDEWCAAAGKINMAAIGQAIDDGIAAKNKLVTSNLRMVQSVVNTYIRNGLSAQYNAGDLMQEGIMALIRAAEKFEPDRGWKFSTYAMYWVRASVKRSQMYQSRIIPVPQRLNENHKRLKRIEREIIMTTGKRPSMKELGATVGMSEEQVIRCMTAMAQRCYSLDQEIHNTLKPSKGGDSKDTLIEIVESKSKISKQNEYDRYERVMLREDLVETLNRYLPPIEAQVLLARYGLIQGQHLENNSSIVVSEHGNIQTVAEQPATIAQLSRMFDIKPDKLRRMIDQSLKHLNGVGLDEWLAFERELP